MALFASALLMTAIAFAFVITPLIRSHGDTNEAGNLAVLCVTLVFGLGVLLYGVIGRPDIPGHAPSSAATAVMNTRHENTRQKAASVSSLLAGLEERLEQNPQDGKAWLLLAQSYELLGRLDESTSAYNRAVALGISNDQFAARLFANKPPATE